MSWCGRINTGDLDLGIECVFMPRTSGNMDFDSNRSQEMTKHNYCFELKSRLSELKALCGHLENCGYMMKLPHKCLFEINLGLDELFTNIISYGFEDESEHQIKFSLLKNKETLVVQVEDDGKPFNPLDVSNPGIPQDLDSMSIGGLGIHLIKNMMDDIDYQRAEGKNRLTFKKFVDAVS